MPDIKTAIYRSADVTKADRLKMVLNSEEHLRELGLQSAKVQRRSLYSIMQRPLPQIDAATESELKVLEEFFQQNGY